MPICVKCKRVVLLVLRSTTNKSKLEPKENCFRFPKRIPKLPSRYFKSCNRRPGSLSALVQIQHRECFRQGQGDGRSKRPGT